MLKNKKELDTHNNNNNDNDHDHIHYTKVMRAPFQVKTLQFSIGILSSVLLGHFLHDETFKFGFVVARHEE